MNSSADASLLAAGTVPAGARPTQALLEEVRVFRSDCARRYGFNNRWDVVLSTVGILLSVAVVAAGFFKRPEISAILGAIVGAVVTSQKAFPFGQRARFYRLLIGQADNLATCIGQDLWTKQQAVAVLATLRMDFAQELPRGTTTVQDVDGGASSGQGQAVPGKGVAAHEDVPGEISDGPDPVPPRVPLNSNPQ